MHRGWWLFAAPLFAQDIALDSIYGMAGLRLETEKGAFASSLLVPRGTFQRKAWYRWAVDTTWEGISIAEVHLAFYRDKLHTIELKVSQPEAARALLVLLETYFGKGKQDGYAPRYRWQGHKAALLYDQNILTRVTTVRLESLVLQRQLERDVYRDYQSR